MYILGISALYHDSAAALICDGEILAAAQEERFTRIKHDSSVPVNAIKYCMKEGKIAADQLDAVVYYDNPLLTIDRYVKNLQYAGKNSEDLIEFSFESIIGERVWIKKVLEDILGAGSLSGSFFVAEHHISHAASAFFPSPYQKAAILTIDGVGEWATTTIGYGEGSKIKILKEIDYPHSLGLLYSAFTYFCGFKVNSGDYKLMGLAPYGQPVYEQRIKEHLIDIKEDGSYRLNLDYFDYQYGRTMTNEKFAELFDGERRMPESSITKREMDIAASIQKVLEEVVLKIAQTAKLVVGGENLVMAGGVALNCVANGVLLKQNVFKNIWIQPAAGDAGGAVGAALYYYYQFCKKDRMAEGTTDRQKGSYLGPRYSEKDIRDWLDAQQFKYTYYSNQEDLYCEIAKLIAGENVIGLFHGRMEYGPRALGNRSIIGDARSPRMQSKLNLKIKYRESFRPFAPSVLAERAQDYFDLNTDSPYMLLCADVNKKLQKEFYLEENLKESGDNLLPVVNMERSIIPAVTHVDYSARIQTVSEDTNPVYYGIIKAFEKITGCGVIVNTSFNVRGEPIVCTPEDAYLCFMRTEMDILVLENMILRKEEQRPLKEDGDWRKQYALD